MHTQTNLVTAAVNHIKVYQGDTSPVVMTFTDTDTTAPVSMAGATVLVAVKFKTSDAGNVYELSTTNGEIVVSGTDSNILTITGWEAFEDGSYVYDLRVTQGTEVKTYLRGTLRVIINQA